MTPTAEQARSLPKVLLHDHLDGGLRPATVLELADEIGRELPEQDPAALQAWFTRGADTADILQYLATFEHTLAVLQRADALERVAFEAVDDLAGDGVVYAELRFAPELHQEGGLHLEEVVEAVTSGFRRGEREAAADGRRITVNAICCAMRTADRSLEIAGSSTGSAHGTTRWWASTSPAPRPGTRRRCTPRRWHSPVAPT